MFRSIIAKSAGFRLSNSGFRMASQVPRLSCAFPMNKNNTFNSSSIRFYSHAPELTTEIISDRIFELLESFDKIADKSKITPSANFSKDLNLDSLDIVEVVMNIEEEFSISLSDEQADSIKTVQQAIDLIAAQPDAA